MIEKQRLSRIIEKKERAISMMRDELHHDWELLKDSFNGLCPDCDEKVISCRQHWDFGESKWACLKWKCSYDGDFEEVKPIKRLEK